jgi:site-specific DNA-cytosine methylase
MRGLVLSLFPGADLLGRAFEELGWCVVRGPDVLWGGDVRTFRAMPRSFDGVIGGPPCQVHSPLTQGRTRATDLIPEFLRLVREAEPSWAVMENVPRARVEIHGWARVDLRDWDCGGTTNRRRAFWMTGVPPMLTPPRRPGRPYMTIRATHWKTSADNRRADGSYGSPKPRISPAQAAGLQGYPGLGEAIAAAQPAGVSEAGRNCLAVHMLGNGVPHAMALTVARHVTEHAAALGRAG